MRFVLVHGAWHGAWAWASVVEHLEASGCTVDVPELPVDQPFESYIEIVSDVISKGDPVILVGHSMAGAIISQVAAANPSQVTRLVFVCAFALRDGESINDRAVENIASGLRGNVSAGDDGLLRVSDRAIRQTFYHDCDPADATSAESKLRPQHPSAFSTAIDVSAVDRDAISRQYIECIEDQAIHISLQRQMAIDCGITLINTMRCGHSPFLAAPAELVGHLLLSGPPPA